MQSLDLSPSEAVDLGAVDGVFFARHFFPETCRQGTPKFHARAWELMDDATARFLSFIFFRDGAKTTTARIATSKRIAYGLSRTIVYVGKSQDHAARSIEWLLKQIQFNRKLADTFRLVQGGKWTGTEVEIINELLGVRTRVLALGITGSVRGINVDDYRPDFIIGDDLCDEENSATPEARQKIEDLWFGALKNSLAPATENPDAKMVLLGTLLNGEDLNAKCAKDVEFKNLTVGILDDEGQSVWPERNPTQTVLQEKQNAINRNQLSIWMREKECKLISRETSLFLEANLQTWDVLPDGVTIMVIDPVPPKSEAQLAKGIRDSWDYEVLGVLRKWKNHVYVCEMSKNKGHQPDWTVMEFFRLLDKWRPIKVYVESVGYQKTLQWLLQQAMRARGRYVQVDDYDDKRSKRDTIVDGLTGPIANKALWLGPNMQSLREQIATYPTVAHDDEIEVVARGTDRLLNDETLVESSGTMIAHEKEQYEELDLADYRSCP